jgi:hypothetical protein
METALLNRLQILNWTLTAAMGTAVWFGISATMGKAVLIGIIAAVSFGWLRRDLNGIFNGPLVAVKFRFFIRYYARFSLLALSLYWLIKYYQIHPLGILLGLSVILLSMAAIVIGAAKRLYFPVKEAS